MLLSPDVSDRTKADSIESLLCSVHCYHVHYALTVSNTTALDLAVNHGDESGDLLDYLLSQRFTGIWTSD